ncbi:thiamine pyrophosphate-binding protein [Streptomyces angustmyceticus]|uniref:thiamine pyrophosphate-binding protein n=1 Tax=Streptomyces angustmyceticus TaxID=285578 RepID=UPI0021AF8EB9|nr:thiamine pyrophosphate-binding protein [Streptomyces angustmyceticus]
MPNVAREILDSLWDEGVSTFFMVPGKMINAFMSSYRAADQEGNPRISPVVAAVEGGAAMMADGYARASEKFGAVIALDGPGVANTVGGLVNAHADRSPVLLLSGHIPTGFDAHDALQDVTPTGLDMAAMLTPVTSSALQVRNAAHPIRYWDITLKKLVECPTRPAYLSYPADVLFAEPAESAVRTRSLSVPRLMCDEEDLSRTVATVNASSSVAVLVGSHANNREVRALLTRLSDSHDVLVGSTVDAKGAFTESHPNNVGVFGYSGNLRAIDLFTRQPPETVLLLGCRPSQWNTNAWDARLSSARNVIEVTSSIEDIGNFAPGSQTLLCDELTFLETWESSLTEDTFKENRGLCERVRSTPLHEAVPDAPEETAPLHPARAVQCLNSWLADRVCVVDSGNHRSFATHYWTTHIDAGFHSSTSMGVMGWAFGAAIGVSFARNEPCLVISGDGCALMHGMEIQTAVRYRRNIIFAIFDNSSYGATYMNNKNNLPELSVLPVHDWVKFAESMGASGFRATSLDELDTVVQKVKDADGVHVIHVMVDRDAATPAQSYRENLKSFEQSRSGSNA